MKKTFKVQGRTFVCYVRDDMKNHASVNIFEVVRPKWKIFRTKYRDTRGFWVNDFASIKQGVRAMILAYIGSERADNELCKKWKEFEEG